MTKPAEIAHLIDHTLLKPEATLTDIENLCREAVQYGFWSVCVHPVWVTRAAACLRNSPVRVGTVAGFPFGANLTEIKLQEARCALRDGAREIDMVLNIGALKSGDAAFVLTDIRAVAAAAREAGALSKVILETCLLTTAEKARACELCVQAGADFVKTSTGFSGGGATVEDIALMSRIVKPQGLGVKASGGIRSLTDLQNMVAAGATRLGTSSGVKIMRELAGQSVTPGAGTD